MSSLVYNDQVQTAKFWKQILIRSTKWVTDKPHELAMYTIMLTYIIHTLLHVKSNQFVTDFESMNRSAPAWEGWCWPSQTSSMVNIELYTAYNSVTRIWISVLQPSTDQFVECDIQTETNDLITGLFKLKQGWLDYPDSPCYICHSASQLKTKHTVTSLIQKEADAHLGKWSFADAVGILTAQATNHFCQRMAT